MDIKTTLNQTLKDVPADYSTLRFGHNFTDHMLLMPYRNGQWQPAKIVPYGPLHLDPAACCLHYGQEIFEGMKCYGLEDGSMQMFRPEMNFQRMNRSAKRMCMPEMDIDYVMGALKELLKVERRWVPTQKGTALYIRPTMISDEPFLGVHAASEYLFFIILSPVGAYFKERLNDLAHKYNIIKDVRGMGLILGMEIDYNCTHIVHECLKEGFLINCAQEKVLRFLPPLIVDKKEIDSLVKVLDNILNNIKINH